VYFLREKAQKKNSLFKSFKALVEKRSWKKIFCAYRQIEELNSILRALMIFARTKAYKDN